MGLLTAWLVGRYQGTGEHLRLFLATGILGGFTTFSAFSLDAVVLWERGEQMAAMIYVAASVVFAIAALAAGLAIGRAFA
jgi:CrcB protein